jgi:aryl-alcohol dehydrogenase-like predicted oxidoreductase
VAVYIENFRNRVIKKLNFSHYNGEEERTETIPAGGSTCLKQLKENIGALRVNITPEVDKDLKKLFHY